ncbi:hypothetical protein RCO27_12940 [Sphingosinicella sp. LHD-64]|uniref:hypothetical protein n=1 Tax=Sphingosinicella sp. LHD-64 TaxID=3072139 RepID=UPI00280EAE6A|nr:hypothetical protein [Sphingosinicella sp. LHD-64]MDQ8757130.1 hypothetical protein [Sphingosinicella sp. LHD-64]
MKAILIGLALASGTAQPAPLDEATLRTYPDARGMPADVQQFIVQWQDCAHWIGEPAWNAERQRQINEAVAEICPGVDARGAALRERYAGNEEVLARIARYEALDQ